MFDGFEQGVRDVDGTAISYVRGGSGPPVLLLHGFPQTKALWARVAPMLTGRFTVIAADLRGYGDSAKPPGGPQALPYAFRAMAADQIGLMRALGYETFHLAGHDRGGRTGHRLALDYPNAVRSLAVLDIVPTYAMFMRTSRQVANAYWHWYFLAQPEPMPERLIGCDPDFFFETCLVSWGKTGLRSFDADMLAAYREAWRRPDAIHGMVCDYRAALTIDLDHDAADRERRVQCPTLALWGTKGMMHALFDMRAEWELCCADLSTATVPGAHFFIDEMPEETARILGGHLARCEVR